MPDPPRSQQATPWRRIRFQDLMRFRVHNILLVSSLYDSFILAEDGQLHEAILSQFLERNLSQNPDLTRVSSGAEALKLLAGKPHYDLVITTLRVGDMSAVELAGRIAQLAPDVPVLLLAYNNRELTDFRARHPAAPIERIFLWQGDVRILLAMVKDVEDRRNVAHDTGVMGVPAIIVVEDNVRFYSSFLPAIYTELMVHTQGLVSEGVNLSQKLLRMRARPKILLCENYEQAWSCFATYEAEILGVISDIEFPRNGALEPQAGVELASRVREVRPDIPMMLQSSFPENEALARAAGASFLLKGSPVLLQQLRQFIVDNFGFGDFAFRLPDGQTIDVAPDLKTLVQKLHTVPVESIVYHGERNHFSNWLKARAEFSLAHRLRPRQVSDYTTLEELRLDLIRSIGEYRRERARIVVADFDRAEVDRASSIARIGGGSLGGKARGLAFANRLLYDFRVQERFPGVALAVPPSVVVGTDVFERFLEQNDLRDFAIRATSDAEIERRFLEARFPEEALADLEAFAESERHPLAVRSSGLLEDSPSQPFAGVYQTFMLANNEAEREVRLARLVAAIKRVYASTFSQLAKTFLEMTPFRLEEEKMAVILQRIVGRAHGELFYPDFSGVARSHNFYPTPPHAAEDGVVAVALGFGRTVVDGCPCLRFCPRDPGRALAVASAMDAVKYSQREFFALDLDAAAAVTSGAEGALVRRTLQDAEADGTLAAVGSTYSPDNDAIYDGIARPGVRLVSFAPILKHELFPLARILEHLLEVGTRGTSSPVEIEFAVDLRPGSGLLPEFGFLQMRPLALSSESEELEIGHVLSSRVLCRSTMVLGHGRIADLRHLVVVDYMRYDRGKSRDAAREIARLNAKLQAQGQAYLLIGVGRWGSADPFLGIPVSWGQISGARVIVEAGFRDLAVSPSQGTHFFQNLTSCNVGYFTVNPEAGDGFVDWDWLAAQPAVEEGPLVRHLELDRPLEVKMSGRTGEGIVLKPEDA